MKKDKKHAYIKKVKNWFAQWFDVIVYMDQTEAPKAPDQEPQRSKDEYLKKHGQFAQKPRNCC